MEDGNGMWLNALEEGAGDAVALAVKLHDMRLERDFFYDKWNQSTDAIIDALRLMSCTTEWQEALMAILFAVDEAKASAFAMGYKDKTGVE